MTLIIVLGVLLAGWLPTHAQETNERYFQETGHTVAGEFLTYYDSVPDPLLMFGYPITDAFQDPLSGITVQFFQRARFERHIEARDGNRVQLSNLGALLYQPGPEVSFPTDTPACQFFAERGRYVCYAFLDFFKQNGGVEQFGLPISNIEKQDDLFVQYFDRARIEWHPELPAGHRVTLANLGRIYFDQRGLDPVWLEPTSINGITQEVIELQARAFVEKAVLAPNSQQKLFVVVQDQYLRPVPDAEVAVTVNFPDGTQERYKLDLTNAYGFTQYTFSVGDQPVNQIVEIEVEVVVKASLQEKTGTWFRIWW